MPPLLVCLADYPPELLRDMASDDTVEIRHADRGAGQWRVPELVAGATVVIGDPARQFVLDRKAIAAMPGCRLIVQPSVGVDTVDVAAAAEAGIAVANTPGYNAEAVADWVIMSALILLRDGVVTHLGMRAGRWDRPVLGRELGALTVGLVGAGATARAVAARLAGFGSRVVHASPSGRSLPGSRPATLGELLAVSDVVSLHAPLTTATRGLIGADQLAAMKPDALLINAARGPLIDQDALTSALTAGGPPSRVALDVFDEEPLPADSPLRALAGGYLSPHVAASSVQARARVRAMVARAVRRGLAGLPAEHLVEGSAPG
jgi:D-3-phosphoglycerate dehydrogenase